MTKRTRTKKQVGKASGQTDSERRQLRYNQRQILKNVSGQDGDGLEDATCDDLDRMREKNNELFDKVRFAREAVLDGENIQAITLRAARQADRLVAVARYDASKFIRKLRVNMGFLNGPLEMETVVKKRVYNKRKVRTGEDCEEEKPEELEKVEKKKDRASLAEKHLGQVRKVFYNRCQKAMKTEENDPILQKTKRVPGSINLPNLLMNPKSFTESVENLFHFSFLVKKGEAGLAVESDLEGGCPVTFQTGLQNENVNNNNSRQSIVTLDMNSWKDLIEAYDVDKCYVPNRNGA